MIFIFWNIETFTSKIRKFRGDLWGHYFDVPSERAEAFITGNDRRVICTLEDKTSYQCALMPKGDGNYFINVNKKIRDKLNLHVGSSVKVKLKKDRSEYGLPMPPEFMEVMKQDKQGNKLFHELTPGKQRTLIYIAGSVKDTDKRIRKALIIMEHLKLNKGKIDYKQLNQDLRNPL